MLATLERVLKRFGFEDDEVDPEFGVVATVPDGHLYASLVEDFAIERLRGETKEEEKAIEALLESPDRAVAEARVPRCNAIEIQSVLRAAGAIRGR